MDLIEYLALFSQKISSTFPSLIFFGEPKFPTPKRK